MLGVIRQIPGNSTKTRFLEACIRFPTNITHTSFPLSDLALWPFIAINHHCDYDYMLSPVSLRKLSNIGLASHHYMSVVSYSHLKSCIFLSSSGPYDGRLTSRIRAEGIAVNLAEAHQMLAHFPFPVSLQSWGSDANYNRRMWIAQKWNCWEGIVV